MASAGSIFVDLLLRDASYVEGLNRSRRNTNRFSSEVSRDVNRVKDSFAATLSPVRNLTSAISQIGGVLAGAFSVQKIVQYSDTWRQLEGRLSIVAGSMSDVALQQQNLFEIAQRTRQPLEGILSFYTRLSQFIPEAERAQYDLLGVTESVSAALAITGETGASATAALIQFTQAIGTNFEAAGQELRSLQEQAPRLTTALMRALGDGTKSLQQLKEEGVLTRQSVLNALSGMGEEGQKLRKELDQISLTVGQAFTRLDNAFLKFIGQSSLVNSGTSSIAQAISLLAENLDLVAKSAIVLSAAMVSKVVVSFASATASAVAYQIALARMAGVSAAAAASTIALSAAMRGAAVLLGLLGGPIGLAALAAITAYTFRTREGEEAQIKYNKAVSDVSMAYAAYSQASEENKEKIKRHAEERINAIRGEMAELEKLIRLYNDQLTSTGVSGFFKKLDFELGSLWSKVGIGRDPKEVALAYQEAQKAIEKIQEIQKDADKPKPNGTGGSGGLSKSEREKAEKELQRLYEQNEHLINGITKETQKYIDTEKELERLYKANKISVDQYYTALEALDEQFKENSETANEFGLDLEEFGKRAASNIQDAFADFLFDPFQGGLKGMAKGFVDTVRRMIAEAQAAKLAKALFGELAGGEGGGLLGGIFGSIGKSIMGSFFGGTFAEGGVIEPGKFGIVGEGGGWEHAELVMGGKHGATVIPNSKMGGGGNTYNIDARGADPNAVVRIEQALFALAGPGVIEQRVNNGMARGKI